MIQIQEAIENLTNALLINRVNGTNPSDLLPVLSNNDLLTLQTSLLLLDDSLQSYLNSNVTNSKSSDYYINPLNQVDYENSIGLVAKSENIMLSISSLDSNTISESQLYYDEIKDTMRDKQDSQIISNFINT